MCVSVLWTGVYNYECVGIDFLLLPPLPLCMLHLGSRWVTFKWVLILSQGAVACDCYSFSGEWRAASSGLKGCTFLGLWDLFTEFISAWGPGFQWGWGCNYLVLAPIAVGAPSVVLCSSAPGAGQWLSTGLVALCSVLSCRGHCVFFPSAPLVTYCLDWSDCGCSIPVGTPSGRLTHLTYCHI